MLYVDQYVYNNKLRGIHPLEKFGFVVLTIIIDLTAARPLVHILIFLLMLGLLLFGAKIPGYVVCKLLSVPLVFLLVGAVSIALLIGPEDMEMLHYISIAGYKLGFTVVSLELAAITVLKSLGAVSCLYFLALTTPMTEFIFVLKLIKLPGIIIELMTIIYRFVFIFIESAFSIYTAQSARWGYCNYRRAIYSMGVLLANIWGKAFFRARNIYTSLLARGYEGELKVIDPPYAYSLRNMLCILGVDGVLLLMTFY